MIIVRIEKLWKFFTKGRNEPSLLLSPTRANCLIAESVVLSWMQGVFIISHNASNQRGLLSASTASLCQHTDAGYSLPWPWPRQASKYDLGDREEFKCQLSSAAKSISTGRVMARWLPSFRSRSTGFAVHLGFPRQRLVTSLTHFLGSLYGWESILCRIHASGSGVVQTDPQSKFGVLYGVLTRSPCHINTRANRAEFLYTAHL